jgi:acyl dehydratase
MTSSPEPGLELVPAMRHPTSRTLVMFAGASRDFNEIHYDQAAAAAADLPGVIVHGLLKTAWMIDYALDWAGPEAVPLSFDCQYRGIDLVDVPYKLGARSSGWPRTASSTSS